VSSRYVFSRRRSQGDTLLFCYRNREAFIDFVITRIADAMISDSEPQEHETREADIQWNRIVEMELVAHPKLPHPETIEMNYAMQDGVLKVNVRAAVAGYVLRRWNVGCTENHSLKGAEYHLWLRDRQALYFAHELSRRHSVADAEKLTGTLLIFTDPVKDMSLFCSTNMNIEIGSRIAQKYTRCINYVTFLWYRIAVFVPGKAR
jgi:hypothetical protein